MAGSVFTRHGHTIDDSGRIHYDESPCSWEEADKIAGRRLDRRRAYAVIDGEVHGLVRWTAKCSGCDGGGCTECGYHGVVRDGAYCPLDVLEQEGR